MDRERKKVIKQKLRDRAIRKAIRKRARIRSKNKTRNRKDGSILAGSNCDHRGVEIRRDPCLTCPSSLRVFECDLHGECSMGRKDAGVKRCEDCNDDTTKGPVKLVARAPLPRPPLSSVSKLAVVTCFFNPHRGQRRIKIYGEFAEAIQKQGMDLFCIEGLFGSTGSDIPSTWQVSIDSDAVFWHKENLLNIAIGRLPDEYDAVLWIDADVVYLDEQIQDQILGALRVNPIVQPWSEIRYIKEDGTPETSWRRSMSKYNLTKATPCADPRRSYPGMAWTSSRELLSKVDGIYDRCITGGGDAVWAAGVWGDTKAVQSKNWSQKHIDDSLRWSNHVTQFTGEVCGTLTARANHLYHGSVKNRMYVERNEPLCEMDYDPNKHIETASNGTLRWSKYAPQEMQTRVGEYMHSRREDE